MGGERGERANELDNIIMMTTILYDLLLPWPYLLKRIDWVLSRRTMLFGSGPSVFLADREQRNSYALFTFSKIS